MPGKISVKLPQCNRASSPPASVRYSFPKVPIISWEAYINICICRRRTGFIPSSDTTSAWRFQIYLLYPDPFYGLSSERAKLGAFSHAAIVAAYNVNQWPPNLSNICSTNALQAFCPVANKKCDGPRCLRH